MGGEKMEIMLDVWTYQGSPPRRRGKVQGQLLQAVEVGITPAWAVKSTSTSNWMAARRDHPRVGGEKLGPVMLIKAGRGSPPHGRGKDLTSPTIPSTRRITPAWAGKSGLLPLPARPHGDHPRVGGEKCVSGTWLKCLSGSPPRRRGKVFTPLEDGKPSGIIPAWAGKSSAQPRSGPPGQDHPRMGGEKSCPGVTTNSLKGLPPRGRGKAAAGSSWASWPGITPA